MGYVSGRFDFGVAAAFAAQLVRRLADRADAAGDADQRQLPRRRAEGIEVTRLGKRIYNDELKLVGEDADERRRYEIYGWKPGYEETEGTDLLAVAAGADLGHSDPLRPHRPRRPRHACAGGASRRCWRPCSPA